MPTSVFEGALQSAIEVCGNDWSACYFGDQQECAVFRKFGLQFFLAEFLLQRILKLGETEGLAQDFRRFLKFARRDDLLFAVSTLPDPPPC